MGQLRAGKVQTALAMFQDLLRADPEDLEVLHLVALCYHQLGQFAVRLGCSSARTSIDQSPRVSGWMLGLKIGSPHFESFGNRQVFGQYRYLQRDAVVAAFTDSDFHLGGTDAKGYLIGATLGLAKNVWLRGRYFSTSSIDGNTGTYDLPQNIDLLQIDLQAAF